MRVASSCNLVGLVLGVERLVGVDVGHDEAGQLLVIVHPVVPLEGGVQDRERDREGGTKEIEYGRDPE